MRNILPILFLFCLFSSNALAQLSTPENVTSDTLLFIEKNPSKGFSNDYLLFIPKRTSRNKKTVLLVEPNNTGKITDSMDVHKKHAIFIASVSSVGNNIATELDIPLLVPIFPRPSSKQNTYTHALDRDVMLEESPELKRLDIQLLNMIADAKSVLKSLHIEVEDKIFMSGFSASGTFTNRFSLLHPTKIKALAIGGFNGKLMLPQNEIQGIKLNYPLGTNDFEPLFNQKCDLKAYKSIPQYIYMGQLDQNDAVQFDDAYSQEERKIINTYIGAQVQDRYAACQKIYTAAGVNATFKTIENVGHWTTSSMNLDVIRFFLSHMKLREN